MSATNEIWLSGPCEVPRWDRRSAEALDRAFSAAGLKPNRLEWVGDGLHEIGALSSVEALCDEKYAMLGTVEYSLDGFASALEEARLEGLVVSGDGWSLLLPLVSAWLSGRFTGGVLDTRAQVVADVVATLFDLSQSEWGVVGSAEALRFQLPAGPFGEPSAPLPLPAAAPLTYLSPDLAYQVNLPGLALAAPQYLPAWPAGRPLRLRSPSRPSVTHRTACRAA